MQLCFFQEDPPLSLLPIYIYIFSLKVNWAFISLYLYFRNSLDVVWNSRLCLCFSLLFRNVWERKINEELSELNPWNYNTEERVVLANIMEVFEGSILIHTLSWYVHTSLETQTVAGNSTQLKTKFYLAVLFYFFLLKYNLFTK